MEIVKGKNILTLITTVKETYKTFVIDKDAPKGFCNRGKRSGQTSKVMISSQEKYESIIGEKLLKWYWSDSTSYNCLSYN